MDLMVFGESAIGVDGLGERGDGVDESGDGLMVLGKSADWGDGFWRIWWQCILVFVGVDDDSFRWIWWWIE